MRAGDRVKYSQWALRSLREWVESASSERSRTAAKHALQNERDKRGTIMEVVDGQYGRYARVQWDAGYSTDSLPYMVEVVT